MPAALAGKKPNIVLILLDDLGVGDVGLLEGIGRMGLDLGQVGQIAGIGQGVDIDDDNNYWYNNDNAVDNDDNNDIDNNSNNDSYLLLSFSLPWQCLKGK